MSTELAAQIKARRIALGMSAEEAARKAGVGTKTWFRYESGGSIRTDKLKGVCKALAWATLPNTGDGANDSESEHAWLETIDKSHKFWSQPLADQFGHKAAISFVVGSEILGDYLKDDLGGLSALPAGTHLGELANSWIVDFLPKQFMMRYDYDFVFRLRASYADYVGRAHYGQDVQAHTPVEELLVRLIRDCSFDLVNEWQPSDLAKAMDEDGRYQDEEWEEWPENLCTDDDFCMFLSNDRWIEAGHPYHFDRWFERQFFVD